MHRWQYTARSVLASSQQRDAFASLEPQSALRERDRVVIAPGEAIGNRGFVKRDPARRIIGFMG